MAERKSKRESENLELESEQLGFILEPAQIEVGSGYTLSVSYDDNEKPIIDVKTYGTVDIPKLRREIERVFPHAKIRRLNETQSVTIIKRRKGKQKHKKKSKR
jgi:hypothetical protein